MSKEEGAEDNGIDDGGWLCEWGCGATTAVTEGVATGGGAGGGFVLWGSWSFLLPCPDGLAVMLLEIFSFLSGGSVCFFPSLELMGSLGPCDSPYLWLLCFLRRSLRSEESDLVRLFSDFEVASPLFDK